MPPDVMQVAWHALGLLLDQRGCSFWSWASSLDSRSEYCPALAGSWVWRLLIPFTYHLDPPYRVCAVARHGGGHHVFRLHYRGVVWCPGSCQGRPRR